MPLILLGVLLVAAVTAYAPLSERRIRDVGTLFMTAASVLAVVIAWPGFSNSFTFGPSGVWYLDGLAALTMLLIAFISFSAAVVGHRYLGREHQEGIVSLSDLRLYYAMVPLFVASMYMATMTNNVGLLWIAIEATTLATTLLVSFYRKRSAIEAAWKYVLLCSLGISFGLMGVLLIAHAAGQDGQNISLLLSSFRQIAADGGMNVSLLKWAFVFLFIGIGTKVGFVPMHAWLPDAHSKTPSPISGLLSGILLNVAFVALLRFKQVADIAVGDGGAWTGMFFVVFGCLSIVLPALVMLIQRNYKRLLAYSSIEHMGILAFAIGIGPAGFVPALMHMTGHALMKSSLFFGAGEIFVTYKTTESNQVKDVWLRLPKTALLFTLTLLFLLAIPPSALFVSEMLMIGLGLDHFLWPTLVVLISLSIVFVSMMRHFYGMFFGEMSTAAGQVRPAREPWSLLHLIMIVHLLLAAAVGIYFLTTPGLDLAVRLAESFNPDLLL